VQCTWGARRRATAESCRLPPHGRVDRCYWGDTILQVATPPTASEFRGGIIGVTLSPVSAADFRYQSTCYILRTRGHCISHFFSWQHGTFKACLRQELGLLGIGSASRRLCIISATFGPSSTGSAPGQWHQHNVHGASGFYGTAARYYNTAWFIAQWDFIFSLYSDRPDAAPSPAPEDRDHFELPLSFYYEKNCSRSIFPSSSSSHSFFHDSLVSNNLRALDDCMHDSSMSRPHPVRSARVEQTRSSFLAVWGDAENMLSQPVWHEEASSA